jgi:AcrR family transcriptional regulator
MKEKQKSTRERIIDSTQLVIQEQGFGNATTKEIARAAGVAEGSLYKNFDDKFDVLVATMLEGHESMSSLLTRMIANFQKTLWPLEKQLVAIAKMALTYYRDIAPIISSVMAQPETLQKYQKKASAQNRGPAGSVEILTAFLEVQREKIHSKPRKAASTDIAMLAAQLLGGCFLQAWSAALTNQNLLGVSDTTFCNRLARSIQKELLRE